MTRRICTGVHRIESVSVPPDFEGDPATVLATLAQVHGLRWLLAHADDGVIWGKVRDGKLHLSGDAFPQTSPPLRAATLQQARLFGPEGEILVWKEDAGWRARRIQDGDGDKVEYYDEAHLLWGDREEGRQDGFVLLCQGREGLRHAPPLPKGVQPPARLHVRHYLAYDPDGQACIAYSRLVGIEPGGEQ